MDFGDLSARFRQANQSEEDEQQKPFDHAESFRLRGKMLGVLIRDARLDAARTVEDCARLLNVTPAVIEAWEYGDDVPSLPHLELLAYYLDVPISHFWAQNTLETDPAAKQNSQAQYLALRQRMIGGMLRQAREEAGLSIEDVSGSTQIPAVHIQQYELGDLTIPMHELTVLAHAVNKNMSYFQESNSYVGELLQMREEWKHFLELDDEVRQFAANPLNIGFIQIAMMFSRMPTNELRKVAEGMLEITM